MKKVGLALGGGAAHGIAHIGVLQVLIENNIPIDYVAGCSAGAIVGGLYCTGSDMYLAGKLCASLEMSSFIDIIVPRLGFIKGEKAEKLVDMLCKGKNIEECQPPFKAVACDIITGKCIEITNGRVARACHASFAIPGVFEPVDIDGMQLIDGGAITRVPIEEVRRMGAEYVIAVDVGYQGSGHKKAKNLMEVLMYAFEMSDWQNVEQVRNKCDCLIDPDLRDIPLHNLSMAEETVRLGRIATEKVIDKIKEEIR
jgi:NTE family protein